MKKSRSLFGLLFGLTILAGCTEELAFRTITLAPGSAECSSGGLKLEWGEDKNENHVLDDNEVTGSSLSCNIPLLIKEQVVEKGQKGCNEGGISILYGHDTDSNGEIDVVQNEIVHCNEDKFLVRTDNILPGSGSECPQGGIKLLFGTDTDGNGTLEDEEVEKNEKVCQQRIDGYSNLVKIDFEEPGQNCLSGGQKYRTGLDLNTNLQLENNEVLYTSYVCHGDRSLLNIESIPPGTTCETGGIMVHSGVDANVNGALDNNEKDFSYPVCHGRTSLVRVDNVNPGATCEQGGIKVHTGFDRNADSTLSNDEINTTEIVCDGVDGLTSLITLTELPIDLEANCQFGGTLMKSGLDVNRNGELEEGEIVHSNEVCKVQVNENQNLINFKETYPEDGICEYGGVITQVGLDANNDRQLQPTEVTNTATNCNELLIVDGKTTLTRTRVASTSACQYGGFYFDSGVDDSRNGLLESGEVTNTQLVCNGVNGFNSLTRYEDYTGSVCASNSGYRIHTGLDTNRSGYLDSSEIANSSYLCDGEKGDAGFNTLVSTVSYSGISCGSNGGVEVRSGLDTNRDNVLSTSEIVKKTYVCHGEDGFDGYDGADALVKTSTSSSYSYCNGTSGVKIESGTDDDFDGYLDSSEIMNTHYVCDGYDGVDGLDGVNGYNGYDGADAIVEVSGDYYSYCDYSWGVLVEAGTDYDGDGYLDYNEINSSEYICEE